MPPRALTEPAMGSSLSRFKNSLPVSPSFSFSLGVSVSGDSMIPPDASVSGKSFAMSGAKRLRRASASSISANVNGSFCSASAAGRKARLNQSCGVPLFKWERASMVASSCFLIVL